MRSDETPVFVVGVPRSGTTVLSVKLAESTGIAMAPETHFLSEIYERLKHLDLADDAAASQAVELFEAGRWFRALGLEPGAIKTAFLETTDRNWPSLFASVLRLYAQTCGTDRWGEKTPGHYRYVGELLDWYPGCRIVFLMRDPRAVVASNIRAPFSPSYAWFVARRWREMLDYYDRNKGDERVCLVRYEDFVDDAGSVLRTVVSNLGLRSPAGDAKSRRTSAAPPVSKGWRAQHLESAAGPVRSDSVDRWRSQLSEYETWVTERQAGSRLEEFGYRSVLKARFRVGSFLRHMVVFPAQRLRLAIFSATHYEASLRGVKSRILRALGVTLDQVSYVRHRAVTHVPGGDRIIFRTQKGGAADKTAIIFLGSAHVQASSFVPLSSDGEVLGVFIASLLDLAYDVTLAVSSSNQFFAARKLAEGFAGRERIRISSTRVSKRSERPLIEIYLNRDPDIPIIQESLCIDAACAKKRAFELNEKTAAAN